MRCFVSVVIFNIRILAAQSSIISYFESSTSDLQMRTVKWCFILFGVVVHAVCDTQDSLMRGDLQLHRRPSRLIVDRTSPVTDPKDKYWSRIAIFAYPTCIRRSS